MVTGSNGSSSESDRQPEADPGSSLGSGPADPDVSLDSGPADPGSSLGSGPADPGSGSGSAAPGSSSTGAGGGGPPKKRVKTEVSELDADENKRRTEERRRWFREGRCPWCGELGGFVAGAPVCSTHGPYPFVSEPKEDEGLDEKEMLPEE